MNLINNPYLGKGIPLTSNSVSESTSNNATKVSALINKCPVYKETPFLQMQSIANELDISNLYIKDERERMGLGSFKATGAAYVIACDAVNAATQTHKRELDELSPKELKTVLNGKTYVCSSAGNHGLSIAAGARVFGAKAIIYLSNNVPESFAKRLRTYDAEVVRFGDNYEVGLDEAKRVAELNHWILLSDTSWFGYTEIPYLLMEGYLIIAKEIVDQCTLLEKKNQPTHVLLQAGVGGMAGALAGYLRQKLGEELHIIIVEPDKAPALFNSIKEGAIVYSQGDVSNMGRLDCKEPSHIAFNTLSRTANSFITISDKQAENTVNWLSGYDIDSTPTAVAGLSIIHHMSQHPEVIKQLGINKDSSILCILTEKLG